MNDVHAGTWEGNLRILYKQLWGFISILCVSSKVSAVKWKCWLVFNPVTLKIQARRGFFGAAELGNLVMALCPIWPALSNTSESPSLLLLLFKFPKHKDISLLPYLLTADQIKSSRCCFSAPCVFIDLSVHRLSPANHEVKPTTT